MFHYKQEIPAMTDLVALYSSVGWTNYTNNPTMLEEAVKASLWQLAVYDEKELVAYIRLVGDGHSVLLVQDLLVRPDHQRQGHRKETLRRGFSELPKCLSTASRHRTEREESSLLPVSGLCRTFRASLYRDDLYEIREWDRNR